MFNGIVDKHTPFRLASRKEARSFLRPWLTKDLLTSTSKKNSYEKFNNKQSINFYQAQIVQK